MDDRRRQHESIDDPRLQAGFVPADPDLTASVRRRARAAFGGQAELLVVAPGRVEIVGNHLDYNGGDVIAAAVDRWVAVAARQRTDGQLRVFSGDIGPHGETFAVGDCLTFDVRESGSPAAWTDAACATVAALHAAGITGSGADLYYRGTIPPGIGLSSSSALLVALSSALAGLAGGTPSRLDIARIAMDAEHRTGTPVGLMDHTASIVGGILRFSNDPARIRVLDAHLGDALFVLIDSGVRHGMPGSRYAVRVAECRQALGQLQAAGYPINALAELPYPDLESAAAQLPSHLADRVRHVVEEVARISEAEAALEAGDLPRIGEIMNASGKSSATLYDISHPAVEYVAASARSVSGVHGARMMGGGDGGSAIALVEREAVSGLAEHLPSHTIIACRIARGMSVIRDV
jgi:galactokinase